MTIKEAILTTVEFHPGISAVKLALDVMCIINPLIFENAIYQGILDKLVKDREVIELEYTLTDLPGRLKSLYFPRGTAFILDKIK